MRTPTAGPATLVLLALSGCLNGHNLPAAVIPSAEELWTSEAQGSISLLGTYPWAVWVYEVSPTFYGMTAVNVESGQHFTYEHPSVIPLGRPTVVGERCYFHGLDTREVRQAVFAWDLNARPIVSELEMPFAGDVANMEAVGNRLMVVPAEGGTLWLFDSQAGRWEGGMTRANQGPNGTLPVAALRPEIRGDQLYWLDPTSETHDGFTRILRRSWPDGPLQPALSAEVNFFDFDVTDTGFLLGGQRDLWVVALNETTPVAHESRWLGMASADGPVVASMAFHRAPRSDDDAIPPHDALGWTAERGTVIVADGTRVQVGHVLAMDGKVLFAAAASEGPASSSWTVYAASL